MRTSVSVVIPTLGRPHLHGALRSVAEQTHPVSDVIVVDDGAEPIGEPLSVAGLRVVVLRTSGRCGAAAARNVGMRAATGELVAFLDDDDLWLPDHVQSAATLLAAREDVDIYACAALVRSSAAARVEPTVTYTGPGSLLDFYYGRTSWARRRRRVMTPTLVFRQRAAKLAMDESMRAFEDLWWLFQLERRGFRIAQVASVGVVVNQDDERLAGRLDLEGSLLWADKLDSLTPGHGTNFLIGHVGRQLARTGHQQDLTALVKRLSYRGPVPPDLRIVLLLERLLVRKP